MKRLKCLAPSEGGAEAYLELAAEASYGGVLAVEAFHYLESVVVQEVEDVEAQLEFGLAADAELLGEVEGATALGEVSYLWERGFLENRLCGCGKPFNECSFWRKP